MTDNEYLQHYGVIGMKWRVHKARRKAQSEHIEGRSKKSTGKNYDEARKNRDLKMTQLRKNRDNAHALAIKTNKESDYSKWEKHEHKYLEASINFDDINKSKLKDIGYNDVQKGADYLKRIGFIL